MTTVDFWFDPSCPFTWITSRWLTEVAGAKDLDIIWHLWDLGRDVDLDQVPDDRRARMAIGLRGRRLLRATQEQLGNEAIGAAYLEWGRRFHHDRQFDDAMVDELADALGLPPTVLSEAGDPDIDRRIHADMDEGRALVGPDVGSPVLSIRKDGFERKAYFGPVLLARPEGPAVLRLWDLVDAAFEVPQLYELKRGRTSFPDVGPRP